MLVNELRASAIETTVSAWTGALVPSLSGQPWLPRLAGPTAGTAITTVRTMRDRHERFEASLGGSQPYVNRSADPMKERGRVRRVGACVALAHGKTLPMFAGAR